MNAEQKSILHIMSGAIVISFSAVWVNASDVGPTISAFYRVLFGSIFLLLAAIKHNEINWHGLRHLLLGFLCGFIFSLDLFFWHRCINYVGPGLATLLGNFQVFFMTAIGVLFLGERLRPKFIIAIPMSLCGLFLIVGYPMEQFNGLHKIGISYGIITALCYTGFLLTLKKLQTELTGSSLFYVMALVSLASTLFLGAEALIAGDTFKIPNGKSLIFLIFLGLLSQCLGWILITNALPRIRASLAGLILLLQPSLSFVWDVTFFNRHTSIINWIGVAIAITAVYMGTTGTRTNKKT